MIKLTNTANLNAEEKKLAERLLANANAEGWDEVSGEAELSYTDKGYCLTLEPEEDGWVIADESGWVDDAEYYKGWGCP